MSYEIGTLFEERLTFSERTKIQLSNWKQLFETVNWYNYACDIP